MNKNTNQCQSIERIKKIQEKFSETWVNVQSIQFLFNLVYIVKMPISKMTRFHHDDQDENRLDYLDFFRRFVELQNETSHRRTTLFVDLNEEESINQTEILWNIENVLQLQHWAIHDAEKFLSVFNQCQKNRDEAVHFNDQCLETLKKQAKVVKNLMRDKNFYKIWSRNYHHQLTVFKKKLASLKNELKKIWQINEELQQKINKLKTINETISFQRRKRSFRSISPAESERHDILSTNVSTSTKKSTKHFDLESFISRREGFKWKKWRQKIKIKMIVNVDHWDNETTKIDYVCFRISEKTADHVYVRFDNFSNDLYEIWQNVIKNLTKTYENSDWKNKYRQLYLNLRQGSNFFVNFYVKFRQYIFRLEYLKKFWNQLKMMNALLDKIFSWLWIIYNNFLKSSKTLKKIKTYFIRINNRHKMTRKTREKEKIQKIDRAVRPFIFKQFVPFSSWSIYTFQFFASLRRIIDYRKQKNVDENACFNCHEQNHVAANCPKSKKRIAQMNNLDSIFDDDLDSMHIINESDLNHVSSDIDSDFEQKN